MRVHDLLDHWSLRLADEVYISDGARDLTWREFRELTVQIAGLFAAHLQPGERFALLERNSIEMAAIYFGAARAGVVAVPLNYRLAPPEWGYILRDADCRFVIVHDEFAASLASVAGDVPGVVLQGQQEHWPDFSFEVGRHRDAGRDVDPAAIFHQMYTSGTTGRPKGTLVSHRAVCANAMQIQHAVGAAHKHVLIVMPLFHAGAEVPLFAWTAGGCSIRVMRDFHPARVLETITNERIQVAGFAPAMIQQLVAEPDAATLDFSHLELLLYGSSPILLEVLKSAIDLFRCDFIQAYGMTETSGVATILTPEDHRLGLDEPALLMSAGRPVLGTELRLVDLEGREVPRGSTGEVLVRGPQLMDGYWKLPEATEAALKGGWMRTGDGGRLDELGYLFIADRVKDMIISGGENVYPREVEDVIFALEGVGDVAVVGVPDDRWGEVPLAVIVPKEGADLTAAAIIAHCRSQLAGFKTPKRVVFIDELPRSTVGKVLKRELREVWGTTVRTVS